MKDYFFKHNDSAYNKCYRADVDTQEIFDDFKLTYPQIKINRSKFNSILRDFNKEVRVRILDGFEYKLPFGLGHLRVEQFKKKLRFKEGSLSKSRMRVNWNAIIVAFMKKNSHYPMGYRQARETMSDLNKNPHKYEGLDLKPMKLIYHYNENTSGYCCKISWERGYPPVRNLIRYKFRPSKDIRLMLCKILKSGSIPQYPLITTKFLKVNKK